MKIKIENSIIEVLRPVTDGEEDFESTVNILILNGIEKAIDDGFTGINKETIKTLQAKHIFKRLMKDLTDVLSDD